MTAEQALHQADLITFYLHDDQETLPAGELEETDDE